MPSRADARPAEDIALICAAVLAVLVAIASAIRLHFGVDLTDEAYYAVMPYRFVLGDQPYVSDLNVRQNSGLMLVPLVKLWVARMGGTDGLMLFLRYVYLVARAALTLLGIRALWNRAPGALAVVAPLLVLSFVFFGIPALSYNTMPGSALTATLFSLLLWTETLLRRYAVAAVVFAGVAAFTHPGVAPIALAACIAVVWLSPPAARRSARVVFAAFIAVSVVLIIVGAIWLGRDHLSRLVTTARLYAGPVLGADRFVTLPQRFVSVVPGGLLILACWVALWFTARMPRTAVIVVLVIFVALLLRLDNRAVFACLAAASLPLAVATRRSPGGREMLVVAILSVCCGLAVSIFSGMGFWNASVGADAAVIVTFVAVDRLFHPDAGPRARMHSFVAPVLAAVVVVALTWGQWRSVYRDDPISQLRTVVRDGPYRGIRTTAGKAEYVTTVQTALRANESGKRSMLAFNGLPSAFLMVDVPPALPTTWISEYDAEFFVRMRQALAAELPHATRPMLVMQLFRVPVTTDYSVHWEYRADDPLLRALLATSPRELARTPDFVLYDVTGDAQITTQAR
jgi:hypothetical protein